VKAPAWFAYANCKGLDPEFMFPTRGDDTGPAKLVCKGCVVRDECLEYALVHVIKFGVWGGRSEKQRRVMRHERAVTAS
jgi:WhiB family redox-sensing transcriptional regulator